MKTSWKHPRYSRKSSIFQKTVFKLPRKEEAKKKYWGLAAGYKHLWDLLRNSSW